MSTAGPGTLRVLFFVRVQSGSVESFLRAYEQIRYRVAAVDGHLSDQVCQSVHDPDDWVITSEWVSIGHFAAWERSEEHRSLAAPLIAHTTARRSQRYVVRRQTTLEGAPR